MRKYIFGIALLLLVGTSVVAQETNTITTRFGALTVSDAGVLLFKGNGFNPPVEANNSLDLSEPYQIGATDAVLVTDNGGTACPALYYFVTTSKYGAKVTPVFGSCTDIIKVKRTGDSISVSMAGYAGPMESKRAQRKAALERHVFIYRAGRITENGKPLKSTLKDLTAAIEKISAHDAKALESSSISTKAAISPPEST